jgi:hypothetical protein
VEIFVLSGPPDASRPKVTIAFPPPNADVVGSIVPVAGTASDANGVAMVRVYLGTNPPVTASGTTVWSALLSNIPAGTNALVVEAIDISGNRTQVGQKLFFKVPAPLALSIVGSGTVTGPTNGQMLDLTRGYTLVATPAAGFLFAGWTGSISQASATLPFLMESNLALTAVFVTNRFPGVKGVYNGLFYDTNVVDQQSSGFLTLTLGDLGAYSGKVLMNGKSYPFSGRFSVSGGETNLVLRAKTNALLVRMQLDLSGGSDQLTGSVTNNQVTAINANVSWSAELLGDRAPTYPAASPAALAGNYTLIFSADTNAVPGPDGDSFGRATVSSKGLVSLTGSLADGTAAAQKVPVSKNGALPVYVPLYKDKGALVSWFIFDTNQSTTDLSGLLNWFKQSQSTAKFYAGGFSNELSVVGSRYVAPTTGRVLSLTNAVVGFTNGNLTANFTNNVTLGSDNKVVNNSANPLSFVITKSSGLFAGSVTPPAGGPARTFKGALLQKQNRGAGFLLGTNQTSQVTFQGP